MRIDGHYAPVSRTPSLDREMRVAVLLVGFHLNLLIGIKHLMLEVPTSSPAKLGDDRVAVAEEVDVKVDVVNGLLTD